MSSRLVSPTSELPQPPRLASALADNLSSLPVELCSRREVNTGPWVLNPTPLCFKSQNSDSTNPLCIHLPGCPRGSSHSISTCLECDRGIKTSGGQFLRKDIRNTHWHLPHTHTPIHAPACRYRQEHICTTPYTQMHLHTHFYTHVNQYRKKKTCTQEFKLLWHSLMMLALVAVLEVTF